MKKILILTLYLILLSCSRNESFTKELFSKYNYIVIFSFKNNELKKREIIKGANQNIDDKQVQRLYALMSKKAKIDGFIFFSKKAIEQNHFEEFVFGKETDVLMTAIIDGHYYYKKSKLSVTRLKESSTK